MNTKADLPHEEHKAVDEFMFKISVQGQNDHIEGYLDSLNKKPVERIPQSYLESLSGLNCKLEGENLVKAYESQ